MPMLLWSKEETIDTILTKAQRVSLRQGYFALDPDTLIETEEYITSVFVISLIKNGDS